MAKVYSHILYHGNCYDGFGAAFAAWKVFGDNAVYIPVNYGQTIPALPDDAHVLICDFSYPREQLVQLRQRLRVLHVIDHHKTAKDALAGLAFATFDLKHSGAVLTWRHLHADTSLPEFLLYLEDRDLWRFKLPDSRGVSQALRAYPFDFRVWDELSENMQRLRREAPIIERFTERMVALMCDNCRWEKVGGHYVPIANGTVFFSEVGEELCLRFPEAKFGAYYFDRRDGKRQWGLRSRNGFDVSAVAKHLGGGGHPAAAGFVER